VVTHANGPQQGGSGEGRTRALTIVGMVVSGFLGLVGLMNVLTGGQPPGRLAWLLVLVFSATTVVLGIFCLRTSKRWLSLVMMVSAVVNLGTWLYFWLGFAS
jgi:hypothetical protein